MIVVPERLIAELVSPEAAFCAVEAVFGAMARGDAYNFPVIREAIGHADALYGFKSGFDRSGKVLGLKSGGYWPNNDRQGLTNHQSTVFLFDPDTGRASAMVGGNLLTALRTAAASAVSLQYLARDDAKVLGIVGAGHQAAYQLRAAVQQRNFEKIVCWNYHPEMIPRLAQVAESLDIPFASVELDQLGEEADVIITITSSYAPILTAAHVRPGTHIACMGTDTKGKQELDPAILGGSSVFTDEVAQAVSIGECQHAVDSGLLEAESVVAIGSVINGDHPGRQSPAEVTIFDGTGVGLQDLAVASLAVQTALDKGIAIVIDF